MAKRSSALAKKLRDLKIEFDDTLERKASYDLDANRAIAALITYHNTIEKENNPDARKSAAAQQKAAPPPVETIPIPEQESESLEQVEKELEQKPVWAKKAYRQIAILTHPDKVNNNENLSDSQKERLVSLYKESTSAYQEGKYEILAEVAAELDIEIEIPEQDLEKALESKLQSLRKETQSITKTVAWHWGSSFGDVKKRVTVLLRCCNILNVKKPPQSELEEIIKQLESSFDYEIASRLGSLKRIKSGADRRKPGTRPEKRIT